MSKITKDGLTRSGTGCFYSCTHMATVGVKGLIFIYSFAHLFRSKKNNSMQLQITAKQDSKTPESINFLKPTVATWVQL